MNRKTLWYLLFGALMMVSCSLFQKPEEPKKSVADWGIGDSFDEPSPEIETEHIYKEYHVTYTAVSTDSSHWFVVLQENKKEGGKTTRHGTVSLATPYFDFLEAYNQFNVAEDSEAWFKIIEPISSESVKTFDDYIDKMYNKSN